MSGKIYNKEIKDNKKIEKKKMCKIISIGLLAGLINGMFSTGAGMILVPACSYVLNIEDKKARGTSIFCILIMVITSSFFYYKHEYIDLNISVMVAIGGIIGGIIGAKLLKKINVKYLKILFTIFLIYMSYTFIFN